MTRSDKISILAGLTVILIGGAVAQGADAFLDKGFQAIGLKTPDGGVAAATGTPSGSTYVAPEGGSMPVSQPVCASAPQTVVIVGTSAVSVPASPLAGRKVVRVCVSLENAGSPKVKCAVDAHPIMGFVVTDGGSPIGDVMGPGDCYAYPIDTSHTLKCVSDTVSTGVLTWEC